VDLVAQHRAIANELMPAVEALVAEQAFILGEPVSRFERTLAALCQTEHAVGVASGTDAIELALRALGVGPGDAVVTSALSFVATAEAIVAVGARPVFADVEGFHMTAATLERVPGGLESVRAVVPVHLFGACVEMEALGEVSLRRGLKVIEDAAQAIGATSGGRPAGSLGHAAALSFFPSKNLGGWGDGGAVVTGDAAVAERVRLLRAHGGPAHELLGTNSRLDALQATVLDVKARHLEAWTAARARAADRYRARLASLEGAGKVILPPMPPANDRHVYHQFVLRTARRDALALHLEAKGIEARVYYPRALHQEPCFARFVPRGASLPGAQEAARTAISIPLFPEITPEQQETVARAIEGFFE
jgi:dTDP-4-amino-4,6-dideoxygalactose transaminase